MWHCNALIKYINISTVTCLLSGQSDARDWCISYCFVRNPGLCDYYFNRILALSPDAATTRFSICAVATHPYVILDLYGNKSKCVHHSGHQITKIGFWSHGFFSVGGVRLAWPFLCGTWWDAFKRIDLHVIRTTFLYCLLTTEQIIRWASSGQLNGHFVLS